MVQKKVALPAVGIGALVAGGLAGRRLISRWRRNPDPLNGVPLHFPDGEVRIVTTADGAEINTVTTGEGPTIVCVHGLTGSRHDWAPIANHLIDAGYQVVAIEQRGHGDSTRGTAGYGSTQLGRDLARVFSELDLHVEALMGHSMGGMASMGFAAHERDVFDERVARLVLLGTAASLKTKLHSVALWIGSLAVPDLLEPADQSLRVATGLSVFGERPSLHMVDETIRSLRNCPDDVRYKATAALIDHDVREELGTLRMPALVIGGTRDLLVRPSQVGELAEVIDGAELHMLKGAGHMLIWERHEKIADLIQSFLAASVHQPLHEAT